MSGTVDTRSSFQAGKPAVVFTGFNAIPGSRENYAVHPDGKRFLMIKPNNSKVEVRQVNVVLHWGDEVDKRAGNGIQ